MAQRTIRLPAPYSLSSATIYGTGDVWVEGNPGYIEIDPTGVAPITNYARAAVEPYDGAGSIPTTVDLFVRYQGVDVPEAGFRLQALGGSGICTASGSGTTGPDGYIWLPLGGDVAQFVSDWRTGGGGWVAQFFGAMSPTIVQVHAADVMLSWAGDAPPCRLFPRGDGLGVGSGRHYPPPKSQQRSLRRFGYY